MEDVLRNVAGGARNKEAPTVGGSARGSCYSNGADDRPKRDDWDKHRH